MSFGEAIKTCFNKYVVFSGRAGRAEFWWWALFVAIVETVVEIIWRATGSAPLLILYILVILAFLLPNIAVGIRRLHDIGRSGWWLFLGLIPIVGWIILLIWDCTPGNPGSNDYGPSPYADQAGAATGGYGMQPPPAG